MANVKKPQNSRSDIVNICAAILGAIGLGITIGRLTSKDDTKTPAPKPVAIAKPITTRSYTTLIVTDKSDGHFVFNARIIVGDREILSPYFTDETGRYQLDLTGMNRSFPIWVEKDGYVRTKRVINPFRNATQPEEIQLVRITPNRRSTLRSRSNISTSEKVLSKLPDTKHSMIGAFKSLDGRSLFIINSDGTYTQYADMQRRQTAMSHLPFVHMSGQRRIADARNRPMVTEAPQSLIATTKRSRTLMAAISPTPRPSAPSILADPSPTHRSTGTGSRADNLEATPFKTSVSTAPYGTVYDANGGVLTIPLTNSDPILKNLSSYTVVSPDQTFHLKRHAANPGQTPTSAGLARLLVGGTLMAVPDKGGNTIKPD